MMEVKNKDYDPTISVSKGAGDAATTTVAGAIVILISAGTALANGAAVEQVVTGVVIGALATVGSAIVQGIKRWKRNRKKHSTKIIPHPRDVGAAVILCLALGLGGLSGCATNGIRVTEVTPDGGSLTVDTSTKSTIFAKTEEGMGDFMYTGEATDGSKFDMRAGAAVKGQDGGDPTQLVLGVINAIAPLMAAQAQAQAAADLARPPAANDAQLERILVLLEALMEKQ